MKPGETVQVGRLVVERLSDCEWAVRTPAGQWAGVSEDPAEFGLLGEGWAVEAVLRAEHGAGPAAA